VITYNYETDFVLDNENDVSEWIVNTIQDEGCELGDINYIFCDDVYLHKINVEFLNHDTLTDIISFDYTLDKQINGDIYISIERVKDNAIEYDNSFQRELQRVMIHGILHYLGYKDKTVDEKKIMKNKEDFYIKNIN